MRTFLRSVWTYAKDRYIWVLMTLWITLFLEYASRGDWADVFHWAVFHLPLLLVNAALVGVLLALVSLPTGHPRIAFWVVGCIVVLLGAASGIKLRMMGRPLLPWDLAVAGEAAEVINWHDIISVALVAALLAYFALTGLLLHKAEVLPKKVARKPRFWVAGAATTLLALFLLIPPGAMARAMTGDGSPWDQAEHVRADGFLLSLTDNLRFMLTGQIDGKPVGGDVAAFLNTAVPEAGARAKAERKPNVIVVLSESLWDPTRLPGATFSEDPLPFFHSLQQNYPSGWMLSPEFGGNTANVELEVLTGLSMKMLPDGIIAYEKYINRPVDSLGAIFARQGYQTTAMSPWASWFFNSRNVYKNLGFGKFISIDFMNQEYNSPYLADHEVARNIIAESQKTPGPDFIFANTAENHYDYNPGKFAHPEIQVSGVSDAARGILETYAQGCRYADRMLQMLVDHYNASGEPTLIVFFGDHLPVLGKSMGVYKEAGYLRENDPDLLTKMYRVPVVTWNNFLPSSTERLDFGTNFLGPYVVKQAGMPDTPVTEYLRGLSARVPAVPPRRYWDEWKIPPADMEQYQALENDILFGEGKAYAGYKDRIVNPDYVLGYGPITIDRITGDRLEGRNLPPNGTVLIEGRKVTAAWQSYEAYALQLPPDLALAPGARVQVKVFDLQYPDEAVAESTVYTVPAAQ